MDYIDENWVIRTDELASDYELGRIEINKFSDDQLLWLIHYNFGYSGAYITKETKAAEAELEYRGVEYNENYVQQIVEAAEEYY